MTNWYTAKGDEGKTTLYGQKAEKDSLVFDILGVLDELQTYLGICKSAFDDKDYKSLMTTLQNNVFKIQAEVATKRQFTANKDIRFLEDAIEKYGKDIHINSFILTSSNPISAHLDYARALARKCERAFYIFYKDINPKANNMSLKYLNRLSSLLFVLSKLYDLEKEKVDYK
jgi:cob(I)alamin adenosyltransferase